MQETETVEEMIARFTEVTNALEGLGKVYSTYEKVLKVLGSLTTEWANKMTAIEESNDLTTYSLEELFENLKAYQLRLRSQKENVGSKKKEIAFNATTSNVMSMILWQCLYETTRKCFTKVMKIQIMIYLTLPATSATK